MRIAIVHNAPMQPADPSECGVVLQAQVIEAALREAGHEPLPFALRDFSELLTFLTQQQPDLIFNCCESFRGNARLEMNVAALYEALNLPFTGSSALTLGMCLDKSIAKAQLAAHSAPTPPGAVLSPHHASVPLHLQYPVIVKPLHEDASIGIDVESIVDSEAGLLRRARFIWETFHQPALAEEFIDGREFNVALLGDAESRYEILPISEIVFRDLPNAKHHIVTYEAKWVADSRHYQATVPHCPAEVSLILAQQVQSVAVEAARALRLRDYGRIDLRVRNTDNAVFVLEVNPNPDISPDSGFVRSALASGRTHFSVINEIVAHALLRSRTPS